MDGSVDDDPHQSLSLQERVAASLKRKRSVKDDQSEGKPVRRHSSKRRNLKVKQTVTVPAISSNIADIPADDYFWRKYGQKPIKGSPHPRGYYKCSCMRGCPATKHVERSLDDPTMLIITYKGDHNHSQIVSGGGTLIAQPPLLEKPLDAQPQLLSNTPHLASDDSIICTPFPARRKLRVRRTVKSPNSSNKLPDIPPDEYLWRKYGQKTINGSPHPRAYYKCSSLRGCPARKHVERSSDDRTKWIVTYKGDHNHPHIMPGAGALVVLPQ